MSKHPLLLEIGSRVRSRREALGLTQKQLSAKSGLSLRFLAELERGAGNISVLRLGQIAAALAVSPASLLAGSDRTELRPENRPLPTIALLGLRGAGKSTVGPRLAEKLSVPFAELDQLVEASAGLTLGEIFEIHGEAYYRRLEREALRRFLANHSGEGDAARWKGARASAVLATGGSLVTDRETYRMLAERAITVWLRARPEEHWNRVLMQGDQRPMARNPHALAELRALLAAREPLYEAAHVTIDTSDADPDQVVLRVEAALATDPRSPPRRVER